MKTEHTGSTLIATLGSQPQIVTFALDALLEQGEQINEVYILAAHGNRVLARRAWQRLQQEFIDDSYRGQRCRLRRVDITLNGHVLDDIRSEAEVNAVFHTIRDLITSLKGEGRHLHLCISGGRRMMAMLLLSVAFLFCDHYDRVWHMYTPEETLERVKGGNQMHLGPTDGFRLLKVPMTPWGVYFPNLRHLAEMVTIEQRKGLLASDYARCQQVWKQLSQREREVLRGLAQGLRPHQVAKQLHISLSTVNTYKTKILAHCRNVWNIPPSEPIDYRFVREHFAIFVDHQL